jgi:probable phosphomutase (TIGR03848 family)
MSTLFLLRHGLTAMTGPVLAGRTPGVHLDDRGRAQADAVAQRLAVLPLAAVVTSPMERCTETAEYVVAGQRAAQRELSCEIDERLVECGYGDWTGRPIKELMRQPLWKTVQAQPSAVRFPGGESIAEMSARAVAAVREWDGRLGEDALWVACTHGDIIKAILADALGLHLDQFQRIVPDPCSVSIVRYTDLRPYVLRTNDVGGDLSAFAPKPRRGRRRRGADATVGGGTGSGDV